MIHVHQNKFTKVSKLENCPVNKMMTKINEDHMDKSRLKLDEKDIFESKTKTGCCDMLKSKKKSKKSKKSKK